MAKGQKREAAAAGAAAKKVRTNPNFKGVQEAILMSAEVPESCRQMLLSCIPEALGVPADQRREAQDILVKMIGEVLEGVKSKLEQAAEGDASKVQQLEGSKGNLEARVTSCEGELAAACETVTAHTSALAQAAQVLQAAQAQLQEKEAEQSRGDQPFNEASEKLAALDGVIASNFRPLAEGAEGSESHFAALRPFLADAAVDESLMNALPSTCSKLVTERSSFDTMAIDQLSKCLQERAAALREIVEAGAPAAQARAAASDAAKARLAGASAAQAQSAEALSAAQLGERNAAAALESAKQALLALEPELELARQTRDERIEELEQFSIYNIGCFELLRDAQTPVVPEAKMPEAMANSEIAASAAAEAGA